MLESKELKYIITTDDGKMIAGYNVLKHAEIDVEDLCSDKKNKKFHIYELSNSHTVTDSVLQKTYQLKTTYPLPEPEPEPEPKSESEKEENKDEDKKTEDKPKEEPKKDEEKKE